MTLPFIFFQLYLSSCAATDIHKGTIVYTGYGSDSYQEKVNKEYKQLLLDTSLKSADILYTCYVLNENDHNVDCESEDSPKREKFKRVASELTKEGFHLTLRFYVDLKNQKWRAYWHPKNIDLAFKNLERELISFSKLATQVKANSIMIGSEYEKLSVYKYKKYWHSIIKGVKSHFKGKVIYAANGNPNERRKPEYTWVAFWELLDAIGINYYPPFKGNSPSEKSLFSHHQKNISKLKKFASDQKKELIITEVGFPLAESGIKTPYQWDYPPKEKANPVLRSLSFNQFIKAAHLQKVSDIHLWRYLFNEEKVHPKGYVIDPIFRNDLERLSL